MQNLKFKIVWLEIRGISHIGDSGLGKTNWFHSCCQVKPQQRSPNVDRKRTVLGEPRYSSNKCGSRELMSRRKNSMCTARARR